MRPSFLGTSSMGAAQSLCVIFSKLPAFSKLSNSMSIMGFIENGTGRGLLNNGIVSGLTSSFAFISLIVSNSVEKTSLYLSRTGFTHDSFISAVVSPVVFQSKRICCSQSCPKRLGPSRSTTYSFNVFTCLL